MSSMSSSNTSVYKQSFWHDCIASSKEICCCHANTPDHVQRLCQSCQAIFPQSTPCSTTIMATTQFTIFEEELLLSSGHYVVVVQFLFYHLLPLFELAPPSAPSPFTLSSTPSAGCLHISDRDQIEKEEIFQRSLCSLLFSPS